MLLTSPDGDLLLSDFGISRPDRCYGIHFSDHGKYDGVGLAPEIYRVSP